MSPLGYLLGIEGAALLRGLREGSADREFVEARVAEVRALLESPELAEGVEAGEGGIGVGEVYREWAGRYDSPGNQMVDVEQPVVRGILDGLRAGTALDAACGTGRHTAYLRESGHDVIGVDSSPEMLAHARARVPEGDFREGDLHGLPVADASVDTVVCALALTHVPELAPVLAEFARVLRPGGHLVISDAHQLAAYLRPTPVRGGAALLTEYHRPLSAYLAAALPLGFRVLRCEEPRRPRPALGPAPEVLAGHVSWGLLHRCPQAAAAVLDDSPVAVVWHFRLDGSDS